MIWYYFVETKIILVLEMNSLGFILARWLRLSNLPLFPKTDLFPLIFSYLSLETWFWSKEHSSKADFLTFSNDLSTVSSTSNDWHTIRLSNTFNDIPNYIKTFTLEFSKVGKSPEFIIGLVENTFNRYGFCVNNGKGCILLIYWNSIRLDDWNTKTKYYNRNHKMKC